MSRFQKATRKQLKLRMALVAPTGGGKTYTALVVAGFLGQRVAVIDTENRSASKYVGEPGIPDFDVLELDSYAPRNYVEAIKEAEREGYDVIIVDGVTQAWSGKDGALEMVDKAAKRSSSGNSFTAWRDVTPQHNALVEALVQCKSHLIVTMRAKMEYVMDEDSRGKKTPRKVGMAPVQRDGLEYEFDVVGDLDVEHNLMISKTRCSALDGVVMNKPGRELAEKLKLWLSEGVREEPKAAPLAAESSASQRSADTRQTTGTHAPRGAASDSVEPAKLDEYGLAIPASPCPVVRQGKPNAGKLWSELQGPLIEKMYAENGQQMTSQQREWAEYLMSRRQKRKAAEAHAAAESEAAANERPSAQEGAEHGTAA
ncbi:MAG TPA: ATP-binding protein [Polyangiaceae bacterium]